MVSDDDRVFALDDLLGEMIAIAKNPEIARNVPQVAERIGFLEKTRLCVILPPENSSQLCHTEWGIDCEELPFLSAFCAQESPDCDPNQTMWIGFCPLFAGDEQISKTFEYYSKITGFGSYGCLTNNLFLKIDSGETLRFMAVVLIHELGHALEAYREKRIGNQNPKSSQERLNEDLQMQFIESNIAFALGGPRYAVQAREMINDLLKYWHKKRKSVPWQGRGIALNDCFGKPENEESFANRDASFLFYCQLMAAQSLPPEARAFVLEKLAPMASPQIANGEQEKIRQKFLAFT